MASLFGNSRGAMTRIKEVGVRARGWGFAEVGAERR